MPQSEIGIGGCRCRRRRLETAGGPMDAIRTLGPFHDFLRLFHKRHLHRVEYSPTFDSNESNVREKIVDTSQYC